MLTLQPLESRRLLAANLTITDAYVRDSAGERTDAFIGKELAVQVDYTTTDLSSNARYSIDFIVDGVRLSSGQTSNGAGNANGTWFWWRSGWFATPGEHDVTVRIDAGNDVAESDESDNEITFRFTATHAKPAFTLTWPLEGGPYDRTYQTNYVDIDPTGNHRDFLGRQLTYNGHNAWDLGPGTFERQDRGVEVYAAAGGTVIDVHDGEYDRQTEWLQPAPAANYVVVDHGDGWETYYYHLRRDSVSVNLGDQVAAGDLLGLIGSSGVSDGPHLHFVVKHDDRPVETMMDVDSFWELDIPVIGDEVHLIQGGITNYSMSDHLQELPSATRTLDTTPNQLIYVWGRFSGVKSGDLLEYIWRRPDGSEQLRTSTRLTQTYSTYYHWWSRRLPSRLAEGKWSIEYRVNGEAIDTREFFVTEGGGAPEIRIESNGGDIVVDGRKTPIDFGNVEPEMAIQKRFSVINHGTADLVIDEIQIPSGFKLLSQPPRVLREGQTASLLIGADSDLPGYYAGEVRLLTNDLDESEYSFMVERTVGLSLMTIGNATSIVDRSGSYGNVRFSRPVTANTVVRLSSPAVGGLSYPAEVTIPRGSQSVVFPLGVDPDLHEHLQYVSLTANADGYLPAVSTLGVDSRPVGDSNNDGVFDTTDLVHVFQRGKFEDLIDDNSTYGEGDWNGDGDFTTSDLVFVFQAGTFSRDATAAAELDGVGNAELSTQLASTT